jgi:hypothetical protein
MAERVKMTKRDFQKREQVEALFTVFQRLGPFFVFDAQGMALLRCARRTRLSKPNGREQLLQMDPPDQVYGCSRSTSGRKQIQFSKIVE